MDPVRLGLQFRALRRRAGLTQDQLAIRAGVSRSLISRVERGLIAGIAHRRMRQVATALGATLDYYLRFQGEALDRMLDEAHAELVDAAVALYRQAGWEVAVEVSFAVGGERGSVEVLAWHPPTGAVAANEIKSAVPDSQAAIHVLDRKARLALRIAREWGWTGTSVSRVLVVGESRTSRRRVERHAELFGAAFPIRGRDVSTWIRDPSGRPISGLLFLRQRTVRPRPAQPGGGRHRVRRT
jgi:transcriptional regulator with XRE-family HTH domain